jgi:hypothetical protein
MAKEEQMMPEYGCCGHGSPGFGIVKTLLLVVLVLGGMYIIVTNYGAAQSPTVNVDTKPNIYVSSTPPEHSISVSATSTTKVEPDLLVIQVSVRTESSVAKKAQEDNAAVSADLRSKLKSLGLKDEEIQTSGYNVEPIYQSFQTCDKETGLCNWNSKIIGYRAQHSFQLSVKNLDIGGDIIDAAGTAGSNQTFVDYTSFTLQDVTRMAIEKSLLRNASLEAKSKAGEIAGGLGVSLGKVLAASQSSYFPGPIYYRNSMAEAAGAPAPKTELSPGTIDVSVTVSSSFEVQ